MVPASPPLRRAEAWLLNAHSSNKRAVSSKASANSRQLSSFIVHWRQFCFYNGFKYVNIITAMTLFQKKSLMHRNKLKEISKVMISKIQIILYSV